MNPPDSDFRIHHLKALYEWILSKGESPFLTFSTDYPGVKAPKEQTAREGKLTLNISKEMVTGLAFNVETSMISLMAAFGGTFQTIRIPAQAVYSICGKESKRGESFTVQFAPPPVELHRRPFLTVVS
ncbi:Clp protease ClpP [Pseudomonas fluorescens]|uniref:ClpXP protease specificity-enhancing factor SspB n=1 Tax=Pseudomonas TaxID=286 RepID=UPI000F030CED|nr:MULTISPECIES: ClpXP protease specificity-enhancing factor SspB [Pseudomonas]MBD8088668.1 Clp protease ClpP [Pseudomonas fluorescens]MBD8614871.1 Clp protease ClpP [Pseudomonas putida]MBD8681445.1 Clp protease ClpP [Pseudomonas sp. CFBP 13719]